MDKQENTYKTNSYVDNAEENLLREDELELLGRKVAKSLNQNLDELPFQINQRLSKARALAISKKKPENELVWAANLGFAGQPGSKMHRPRGFLRNIGWLAPAILVIAGLVLIVQWQQDARINDIADLDTAILSDEVPPDAYADNGFWVFLKQLTNQADDSSDASNELGKQ